jgi:hypothetical protein
MWSAHPGQQGGEQERTIGKLGWRRRRKTKQNIRTYIHASCVSLEVALALTTINLRCKEVSIWSLKIVKRLCSHFPLFPSLPKNYWIFYCDAIDYLVFYYDLFLRLPGLGANPGSSDFISFSHFLTLPLSNSGSPDYLAVLLPIIKRLCLLIRDGVVCCSDKMGKLWRGFIVLVVLLPVSQIQPNADPKSEGSSPVQDDDVGR